MLNKLGFHYLPDYLHYQEKDLAVWLPELKNFQASWLVLKASSNVAIPESFISALLAENIQPILDFDLRIDEDLRPVDLRLFLEAYNKWGVKYINFFRAPNMRSSWIDGAWALGDVVSRFLERWVPFMRMAEQSHLIPLFPALEPGGDYWDISFLKRFVVLAESKNLGLFSEDFHMAVSAQTFGKPLSWGAGASAAWEQAAPYQHPKPGQEDHLGFNTWQWYTEVIKNKTGKKPKLILLWAGAENRNSQSPEESSRILEIQSLLRDRAADGLAMPLPDNLLAICYHQVCRAPRNRPSQPSLFGPLTEEQTQVLEIINEALAQSKPKTSAPEHNDQASAESQSNLALDQEHKEDNGVQPTVQKLQNLSQNLSPDGSLDELSLSPENLLINDDEYRIAPQVADWVFLIDHYLLLPSYAWGVPENTLERLRPIIHESHPTIGFSVAEAANARKVTVWNENEAFSEEEILFLLQSGCIVDEQVIHSVGIEAN